MSESLVCNMTVFTPAEREAHILATTRLMVSTQSVRECANGYELSFSNETELIHRIAEFIAKERLCCPFLKFTLKVSSEEEPITLVLTGPLGTQEFLRVEFSGAIQ